MNLTIFGWLNFLSISISLTIWFLKYVSLSNNAKSNFFIATISFVFISIP